MANILDKVVGSPIAFGAINGLMESFVTGRTAEKQEAKAKAIAAQEKKEKGIKSFIDTALTSTDLSYKFITLPGFANQRKQLIANNPAFYNSILLKAHGNKKLSDIETKVIDQSVNDASFAKRFLKSNPNFKIKYPSSYAIVLANAAGDSLNSGEEKLFKTATNKAQAINLRDNLFPLVAKSKIYKGPVTATLDGGEPKGLDGKALAGGEDTEYRDNNATSSNLFWALEARANNDVEGTDFNNMDSTLINTMSKAIEDSVDPLATANHFVDKLEKGSDGRVLDTQALFFLNGFKTKYAKKNDKFSVKDLLKESIEEMKNNTVDTQSEKGIFSKSILDVGAIKKLINSEGFNKLATSNKPEDREAFRNVKILQAAKETLDKVDKKAGTAGISYGNHNFAKDLESVNKDESSMFSFLQNTNDFVTSDGKGIDTFISKLKPTEKAEFLALIKSTITNHDTEVTGKTNPTNGEKLNDPGVSYIYKFSNLYKIPEIKTHIHDQIGEAPEGLSVVSKNIAAPANQNLGIDNPLNKNQVKLIDDKIVTLDNDFVEFAAKKGFVDNPRKLLLDDGYYELLMQDGLKDTGGILQSSNKMYKAVNTISKLVPNIKDSSALRTKDIARITRAIINNDITENQDVFDIVSALQNDDFRLEKKIGSRGYSVQQVNSAIKKLTNNTLDMSKLQQNRTRLDDYGSVLKNAINSINFLGNQSQFVLSFVSAFEDVVTSSSAPLAIGGKYLLDKFNMSDFVNREEAVLVQSTMNKFMSDSRRGNAELDSAMIVIAYNQAKALDPSGRVSDKDFNAALKTISGGGFASVFVTKVLLEGFLDKVEQQQVVYDKISEVFSTVDDNSTMIMIKKNIRTLKAIPLYNKIRTMRTSIDAVRDYRNDFELNNGLPNGSRYQIKRIAGFNYRGVAAENRVFEAIFKNGGQQIAVGIPVYVDQVGRMLNAQELKNRGFNR